MRIKKIAASALIVMISFVLNSALNAATRSEIDAKINASLKELYKASSSSKELMGKARGVLIFPEVVKAGIGIGGEYGEGALRIGGKTSRYYSVAAGSIGLQLGVQVKSQAILFMTKKALDDFLKSDGWEVGVDGSVAVVTLGVGGKIESKALQAPVIGFIYSNKGLMYNLTFEGSKISQIFPGE